MSAPSTVGLAVPDFSAPLTGGKTFKLSEQRGSKVVLYFYPKDATPGCTTQGQNFRDLHEAFLKANTRVFGVSRDSMKSHENFKAKMSFPFDLISDPDEALCLMFDVMKMKNMYGKQVRGIERSTFLIDTEGKVAKEWRGLKVPGHVDQVLEAAQAL
jgi:peroxiredoxin Q/BCP